MKSAAKYRDQARRARRLAGNVVSDADSAMLQLIADDYDAKARLIENKNAASVPLPTRAPSLIRRRRPAKH
jgi:hypothetical protein